MNMPFLNPGDAPKRRGRPPKVNPSRWQGVIDGALAALKHLFKKPAKRPSHEMIARIEEREKLASILLLSLSATVTTITYFGISMGISEAGEGPIQKGLALIVAIAFGIVNWMGYHWIFGLLDRMTAGRLTRASIVSFAFLMVLSAVDAQLITQAIAGASASQKSIVDVARYYEERREDSSDSIGAVQRILPAIKAEAERFAALERQEVEFGVLSGSAKPGKVSAAIGQVKQLLSGLADQLDAGIDEAEAIERDVTASLGRIKEQAYTKSPIAGRLEQTSREADHIDELLARLSRYDFRAAVQSSLDTLTNLFPVPTNARTEFEGVQNDEIGRVREMAAPVAASLTKALSSFAAVDAPEDTEKVRPLTPGDAVKHYWLRVLPEWLLAAFLDQAPGLLAILLVLGRRQAEALATAEGEALR